MIKSSTLKYLNLPTWLRWSIHILTVLFVISALALIAEDFGYIVLPGWVEKANDFLWPFWTMLIGYEMGVRRVIRKLTKRFSL